METKNKIDVTSYELGIYNVFGGLEGIKTFSPNFANSPYTIGFESVPFLGDSEAKKETKEIEEFKVLADNRYLKYRESNRGIYSSELVNRIRN
jgi:hypothetical protein